MQVLYNSHLYTYTLIAIRGCDVICFDAINKFAAICRNKDWKISSVVIEFVIVDLSKLTQALSFFDECTCPKRSGEFPDVPRIFEGTPCFRTYSRERERERRRVNNPRGTVRFLTLVHLASSISLTLISFSTIIAAFTLPLSLLIRI